ALIWVREGALRSSVRWPVPCRMTHVVNQNSAANDTVEDQIVIWPRDFHVHASVLGFGPHARKRAEPAYRRFDGSTDSDCRRRVILRDVRENLVRLGESCRGVPNPHAPYRAYILSTSS